MAWTAIEDDKPPSKTELWVVLEYSGDQSVEYAAGFLIGGQWKEAHHLKPFNKACTVTHWQFPEPFPPRPTAGVAAALTPPDSKRTR